MALLFTRAGANVTLSAGNTVATSSNDTWENSVAVRLQSGDLVVVDNYLASHGRMSWVPPNPRKVLLTHFVQGATAVSEVPSAA